MYKSIFFLSVFTLFASSYGCARVTYDTSEDNLIVLHEKSFPMEQGKLLKIESSSGLIEISSWDKDEVFVKVLGNEKAKEKVEFSFKNDNEVVQVLAKRSTSFPNFSFRNVRMKFQVKVPREFNNEIKTSGGDITISDIRGNQRFKTSGGDVNAKNINGKFEGRTSGGDFKLENISGLIDLSTSGGDIDIKNFKGDVEATTSGGDIRLNGSDGKISANTSGGNIYLSYSGENKGIEMETSGGNIRVLLPSDFNASAKLSTSGGDIESEFRGNNAVKISSSKFEADINKGGTSLVVKTSGGNIELKKK